VGPYLVVRAKFLVYKRLLFEKDEHLSGAFAMQSLFRRIDDPTHAAAAGGRPGAVIHDVDFPLRATY
ncbi:MAG TPA: hypothetical protein VI893_03905, partial [Thermoplasmata archaeon]|nr:hypothetical protein [Thermoplasmata archaeon]